ncbi:hypothetical protein PV729_04290 [Streptomyces europaeiscabiei]|uniref:Uncharacterized protein n=1 Tax=Streptomyces europaeiscabiei TaxID=146819 RepID=A0ABU4N976_9ACTN|nr:hypothetical protein [Streptomyces europaeiscabiei]MDX3550997.1 hypothetical protein [Streptomyces europaeiscabiei]MDX3698443.1 hypothetical protein [Streptomyces europaeiscabiei]
MTLMVRQTKPAFRYPAGKEWGPYTLRDSARARVTALRKAGGDGQIVYGQEPACEMRRPSIEWEL